MTTFRADAEPAAEGPPVLADTARRPVTEEPKPESPAGISVVGRPVADLPAAGDVRAGIGGEGEAGTGEVAAALPASADLAPGNGAAVAAVPEIAPKAVEGYIDYIGDRRVYGWAWCRSAPATAVEVEVRLRDRTLASVRADGFRRDLEKAGAGDGRHGFDVTLDEPVSADDRPLITAVVRCRPEGPCVPLVNRTIEAGSTSSRAPSLSVPGATAADAATPPALPADATVPSATSMRPVQPVRGVAGAPADIRPVLRALATVQRSIEDRLTRIADGQTAGDAASAKVALADVGGEIRAAREDLTRLAAALDVMQARLDTTCAVLAENAERRPPAKTDRGLLLVVAGLAAMSCASLALGLFAVFG